MGPYQLPFGVNEPSGNDLIHLWNQKNLGQLLAAALPTILLVSFSIWYAGYFAKRAVKFDAGFLLCTQLIICALVALFEAIGLSMLPALHEQIILLVCLCTAGVMITVWTLRSMQQVNRQVTALTCYFLTSALVDMAKVFIYMKSKRPFSFADLLFTLPFFTSAVFKLCLISLADITIRFLVTDAALRDCAESLFGLDMVYFWKPMLRWWLDSRAFTLLNRCFHSQRLSGLEKELSPKTLEEDLLRRCRENLHNTSSSTVLSSYLTILQPEMFVVFVPKLLESGFSAATIFLCLPVLTALLQDGELDLVPQLSLCLALASFGKFFATIATRILTNRALSLCKASFGIVANETTRDGRERLGKILEIETDEDYEMLLERHLEMVEHHMDGLGSHPTIFCTVFSGLCVVMAL